MKVCIIYSKTYLNRLILNILSLYLLLVYIVTLYFGYMNYIDHHIFKMGDWLINYQGGFVRRGLLGEIALYISSYTHINVGYVIYLIQSTLYTLFFLITYILLARQNNLILYLLLIFSPFIFTFQINDIWGGFRKEIFYFVILAFTILSAIKYDSGKFEKIFYILISIYTILILSHEMFIIYLPYLLIVYFTIVGRDKFYKILPFIILQIIIIIYFIFSIVDSSTIENIYLSLSSYHIDRGGAISLLDNSIKDGIGYVKEHISIDRPILFTILILFLSYFAYMPIYKNLFYIRESLLLKSMLIISIIGTILLFFIAIDWGRFIYIHLVSIFLLSLLSKSISIDDKDGILIFIERYINKKYSIFIYILLFIIYTTTWHISISNRYIKGTYYYYILRTI